MKCSLLQVPATYTPTYHFLSWCTGCTPPIYTFVYFSFLFNTKRRCAVCRLYLINRISTLSSSSSGFLNTCTTERHCCLFFWLNEEISPFLFIKCCFLRLKLMIPCWREFVTNNYFWLAHCILSVFLHSKTYCHS